MDGDVVGNSVYTLDTGDNQGNGRKVQEPLRDLVPISEFLELVEGNRLLSTSRTDIV